MLPYISIGSKLLQLPGLVLLVGVWIGLMLAEKEATRLKIQKDTVYNFVSFGLISGIVSARLAYALRFLSAYIDEPLSLFALNSNTFMPAYGVSIGLLVAVLYGWRKKLHLRPTLDALTPGITVFMIAIGAANFLSGNAFGAPANIPWAINLWDDYRHPTQIYEFILATGIFLIIRKHPIGNFGDGLNFLVAVALSAASRLFVEAFRGDSLIWLGNLRATQIISLLIIIVSLWSMRAWLSPQEDVTR